MDDLRLVCCFEGESCVVRLNPGDNYESLLSIIRSRWVKLSMCSVRLYYNMSTFTRCLLFGDDDLSNMISVASSCGVCVVTVHVESVNLLCGESSSSSAVVGDGGLSVVPPPLNLDVDLLPSFCRPQGKDLSTYGWEKIITHQGQRFEGVNDFRLALKKLSVGSGYGYIYLRNHANRIKVACKLRVCNGCLWYITGRVGSDHGFYVRKLNLVHTCGAASRSLKMDRMDPHLISTLISDQVRVKGSLPPTDVKQMVFTQYGVNVPYKQAWVSVEKANTLVYGDELKSFQFLNWYVDACLESNPGSRVFVEKKPGSRQFLRMFIAFGSCIKGFNFCRPVLFLDACHLNSKFKGHLMVALGKDGNSGLYPVAFAVVDSENKDNWIWFLQHVRAILEGDRQLTIVSDRHLGLVTGVPLVFPECPHAYCLHHLQMNIRDKFTKSWYSNDFRDYIVDMLNKCAYAPTVRQFEEYMAELLHAGGHLASSFFSDLSPFNWANAYFPGMRYGEMTSNAAESFNSWISNERNIPIASMVDMIRVKLMEQICDRDADCCKWNSDLCSDVDRKLGRRIDECRSFVIRKSTNHIFEVFADPISVKVNLKKHTCSCGGWQLNRLPCNHAVCCILHKGYKLSAFVDHWALKETYAKTYSFPILPIPTYQKPVVIEDEDAVLPPSTKRPPGRPKKLVYRVRGDRRKASRIRCGRCGKLGRHNRRTCKDAI